VRCAFPERRSLLHFEDEDIGRFFEWLSNVLKLFVEENIFRFNGSIFSSKAE